MRQTYRVVSGLIALGVVVQAAAIAFGWFDVLHKLDNGAVLDKNVHENAGQAVHGMNGMVVIPLLGLVLLVVSLVAGRSVPGGRKWAGIVLGLILLQVALAFVSFGAPVVGTLHGLNALAVFATAVRASLLAREATGSGHTGAHARVDVPQQSTGTSMPQTAPKI
ncbi:MAG TPA: hypothetical protein VGN47_12280 [Blastococcus sp.]|jgi:heme A synthase|nr:hypothetical protein [Blastococcus sp.]